MKKQYYLFFIALFLVSTIVAQGETANWYFGENAGIRFNPDGSVTPLSDGNLNTVEGCTSISDSNGQLLAYTDGITVYNKNHQIVQNGTGLYGDPSSTQSAIMVPQPENPNLYYIFTVDTSVGDNDPDYGLNYSILDISSNNGEGAIIRKNSNLLQDTSEKITGVIKDCFEKSIWVITLAGENETDPFYNTYYCYEVNSNGIVTTPIKNTFPNLFIADGRGYLKLSADGTKMASANSNDGLYVYDFDAATGILSNETFIQNPTQNQVAYGVEFSSNNRFLYLNSHGIGNNSQNSSASLIQYDITAADIAASAVVIDEREAFRGALQMAENGKIYRTNPISYSEGLAFLSVINNPGEKGAAANYQHNAVSLQGRNATQGLPPFIQSFFNKTDLIKNPDGTTSSSLTVCENNGFILEADNFPGAVYTWEKDGIPIANTNYFLEISSAALTDAGKYKLEITLPDPKDCPIIGESTIEVNPVPPSGLLSLVQCDADEINPSDGITTINLQQAYLFTANANSFTFLFYENATALANNDPISNPVEYVNTTAFNQTIYYQATSGLGCSTNGEVAIRIQATTVGLNAQSPFYTCESNPDDPKIEGVFDLEQIKQTNYPTIDATFYASLEDVATEQNAISGNFLTESTRLYVRLENANECLGVDEVEFIVNPSPKIVFPETHYLCTDGNPLVVTAPSGFDTYRWLSTNEIEIGNTQELTIAEVGDYILELGYTYNTATNPVNCTNRMNFVVNPSNKASIRNIEIKDISDNNTVEVFVTGDGDYEYSMDGNTYQDTPKFFNVPAGVRTIYIQDKFGCGIREEKIAVIGYPKFFTPNGDGFNDFWQLIGVEEFQPNSEITIFNRFGNLVASITPNDKGWDGISNGQTLPASDYWFKVNLEDGRVFKGHFALKR
ncbi:T9SS type B sorting domain-containing protein [Cellulophaga sp. Hel_I_12]|uniref:T9SS type B sorting domain-containing protein n=1 Tax=Cellulophaga sp. Hel_I_12 TaxID=1249972 RepID=UPI000645D928|nr:T9SS type B sorting domain-containing protein [Cellulophaga sp. Hel_I_12]